MDASPTELRRYQARDRLLDGRSVLVRAIRPDDKQALQDGMHRLSAESAYFRFFRAKHELRSDELAYFTELDFESHVALVALVEEPAGELLVGVGRYIVCEREPVRAAEVALAVDDAYHGLGIGTLLLRHLSGVATAAGLRELRASVLTENHKMLEVFAHCGLPQARTRDGPVLEIRLALESGGAGP